MIEGVPENEMHCVMPCNVWCIIGAGDAICTVHRSRQAIPLMASPQNVPMITGSIPSMDHGIHPVMAPENLPQPYLFPPVPSPYHLLYPSIPYLTYSHLDPLVFLPFPSFTSLLYTPIA